MIDAAYLKVCSKIQRHPKSVTPSPCRQSD